MSSNSIPASAAMRRSVMIVTACALVLMMVRASSAATHPIDRPRTSGEPAPMDEVTPAEVEKIISQLVEPDAKNRTTAARRLLNLPGSAFESVRAALTREDLDAGAAKAIKQALPALEARSRIVKRIRDDQAMTLKILKAAYQSKGKHDEKWDAAVEEAFAVISKPDEREADDRRNLRVHELLGGAIKNGCDDPLVRVLDARSQWEVSTADMKATTQSYKDAADAFMASEYPDEVKQPIAVRARLLGAFFTLPCHKMITLGLAAVLKSDYSPQYLFGAAEDSFHALTPDRADAAAFKQIDAIYTANRPETDFGPLTLKGAFYIKYAWNARGGGFANTVTEEGWKLFHERLGIAGDSLTTSWEMDHTNGRAASEMLSVALGSDGNQAARSDLWLKRALAADPDDQWACRDRLWALFPRWGGSHAAMINFGRQCFAGGNWRGKVGFSLIDAHERVAEEMADGAAYMQQPVVWNDIRACYEQFLEVFPDAGWQKSRYARYACECGQWAAAKKLFDRVGDNFDADVFKSKALYDYYRRKAEKKAVETPAAGERQASR